MWFFVLLANFVVASAAWVWFLISEGREKSDQWSSTVFGGVAATAVAVSLLAWLWRLGDARPFSIDQTEQVLTDLGVRVGRQWAEEAKRREVIRPAPVMVRWSSTGRPSASRQVVLDNESGPGWQEMPLRGRIDPINEGIVAALRGLPHQQLVVLGVPGAGKSVFGMLLTLGLIRRRTAGEPLPVLLPINVWDPGAERVDQFVSRRLVEDYRAELSRHGDPHQVAQHVVAHGKVLPILDGLDEMPARVHAQAVEAVEAFTAPGAPLVVTCRIKEYDRLMKGSRPLSRAAVIELEPVDPNAAIEYLSQDGSDSRWEPVFVELRAHPGGSLARVLSTPLMVALARIAYLDQQTSPAELLALPTGQAVAARLMDAFVTAAYTGPSSQSGTARTYDPQRSRRWLSCLAYHLYRAGTRDLHWWQIPADLLAVHPVRARTMVTAAGMAVAAAGGGLLGGLVVGWPMWWRSAVAAGLMVAVQQLPDTRRPAVQGYTPSRSASAVEAVAHTIRRWMRPAAPRRVDRFGYAISGALLIWLITAETVVSVAGGVTYGLLAALLPPLGMPRWRSRAGFVPTSGPDGLAAASSAIAYGVTGGAVFAAVAGFVENLSSPVTLGAVADGVYAGIALAGMGGWTWARFRLTHGYLAVQGWLPWRMSAFLTDSCHRGLLRRAGTVYQFRHVLLQDHLADTLHTQHLQAQADAGDGYAAQRLAGLLAEHGRVEELRLRADAGDGYAAERLAGLLAEHGRVEELRLRADAGDGYAAERLAGLLAEHGRFEEAVALLWVRADAGDGYAAQRLAGLLAEHGRVDQLRLRADAGDWYAAQRLADLLAEQGQAEEAVALLRAQADAGDGYAAQRLAGLLAEHGRFEELRLRADAGDGYAARRLVGLLAEHGRFEELRLRADAGDWYAARRLVGLLAKHGRVEELRLRADAGDGYAAERLAGLLAKHGRFEEAVALLWVRADAGDWSAAQRLNGLLAEHGRVEELRLRADAGDWYAAQRLADLLAEHGRVDRLRLRADAGDWYAAQRLADLLAEHGRVDQLRLRADAGDWYAAQRLADLLAEHGRVDQLRLRADAGDWYAAQ
ncbi:hypothetical protein, partial [Actinoplanes regularis]|uniref:hypothetical protein n=1 Tax=Actinoplanes regularis TaxID=52697 RepID=UPI002553DACC